MDGSLGMYMREGGRAFALCPTAELTEAAPQLFRARSSAAFSQVSAGRDDSGVTRPGLAAALAARRRRSAAAERGPLDMHVPRLGGVLLDAAQSMLRSRPTWLGGRRASSARLDGSGARGERVPGAGGVAAALRLEDGAEDGRAPAASLAAACLKAASLKAASLAPAHGRAWGMRTART